MLQLLQCGGPTRPELAPNHHGLTTLSSRNMHGEALCSFAPAVWAFLAWLQEKSLAGRLTQALSVLSLLSQDKQG